MGYNKSVSEGKTKSAICGATIFGPKMAGGRGYTWTRACTRRVKQTGRSHQCCWQHR